jgi:hypothetical protein
MRTMGIVEFYDTKATIQMMEDEKDSMDGYVAQMRGHMCTRFW